MKTEKTNNNIIQHGYWLTIEPYVFIFKGKDEYILYNTLSKDIITIDTGKDSSVIKLLNKLRNVDNLYSIERSSLSQDCINPTKKLLIYTLKKQHYGQKQLK